MKHKFLMKICCCLLAAALLGSAACAQETTAAPGASGIDMLAVDHKLYELGYRDSACNGELDDITVHALKKFQAVNGLEITGEPDVNTAALLLGGQAVSERDYLSGLSAKNAQQQVLMDGSYGEEVKLLQQTLKNLGYFHSNCDGAFGSATTEAVYRFQLANGLQETGAVDGTFTLRLYLGEPVSWNEFLHGSCASAGESGEHVRRIQLWLKQKGYFTGECTGKYGEATQQAVKRFQTASGLESSGDVDMETCETLFSDVSALLEDAAALRCGETGPEVDLLCQNLRQLGYPAQDTFGMRTELAVMQFQLVNGLDVTGVANTATRVRMKNQNAKGPGEYDYTGQEIMSDENVRHQLSRYAATLLGRLGQFEDGFEFVQYVYLKCGLPLMQWEQLYLRQIQTTDSLTAGQTLYLDVNGRGVSGIATGDRAIIYQDDSGYIVMRYLDMMDINCIYACYEEDGE